MQGIENRIYAEALFSQNFRIFSIDIKIISLINLDNCINFCTPFLFPFLYEKSSMLSFIT